MTTNNTQNAGTYEIGTTVHVSPGSLLMARNIREATPDKAFTASVKDLGVLEPITAVLTDDGDLLVRFGHRRTLAAIEAGTPTVPVYIGGTDATDKTHEVARIVAQHDENTHRAGLSTSEDVGVVEQLAAFGLSAAQIAKKSRIKRTAVDTALTVSGSKVARKATERYEALTLDQAAVVAEFEDDAETVKALVLAAHEGRFEHVAQRARDDRDEAAAHADLLAVLTDDETTVIERPAYDDQTTQRLDNLCAGKDDRGALSPTDHTGCPGHVAWISTTWVQVDSNDDPLQYPDEPDEDADEGAWDAHRDEVERIRAGSRRVQRPVAVYGCTEWRKNGHHDRYDYGHTSTKPKADEMSPEEREAAKAQRRVVVENNKAWAAAEPVRREFLATFAKTKTPPKGTGRFLAEALAHDSHTLGDGRALATEWLSVKKADTFGRADLTPAKSATENKCLMVALVQALAGYEDNLNDGTWRHDGTHNAAGRYLRFLADRCGYTLSEVEQYAASDQTA